MTAIDEVIKELDDVRKQLSGYDELKAREERLSSGSQPSSRVLLLFSDPRVARTRRRGGSIDPGQVIHALHLIDEDPGSLGGSDPRADGPGSR